ncbi:MAG: dynamin family protein [Deltaproteobacteria bacterium]|nr:dynamin family protein [Deltaproteobacteria bacterium]
MFDEYLKIKTSIMERLAKLENIAASDRVKTAARLISEKLTAGVFSLVVVGQFKRGKTTFINALLGENLLPAAIIPLTSIITILRYGDKLQITVFFANGTEKEIVRDDLPLYITEKFNPKNEKGVDRVEIAYTSQYLKNGVQIIDTPGIGSVFEHNTKTTYEYLPQADACIFLVSADPPITRVELDFLRDLKNLVPKTFFVQSKIDMVSIADRDESLSFSRNIIEKEANYSNVEIFSLSGKEALEGKLDNDNRKVGKSGLTIFERSLEKFLIDEKGDVMLKSSAEKAVGLINEEMLLLELEEKSLRLPLNELENRIVVFKNFIRESGQEKIDSERLLAAEVKDLQKQILEEDLEKLKIEKTKRLLEEVGEFANTHANESNAKFAELMGGFLDLRIKEIFNIWRVGEEKILKKHLEEIFKRFLNRMNKILEQIIRSSTDIFGISYRQIRMQETLPSEIEFRFLTMDEPSILSITLDLARRALPKMLGHKLIVKEAKEKAEMLIDRHCGKARYDFSMRLDKLMRNYHTLMTETIDTIQNNVLKALEAGIVSKQDVALESESLEKRVRDKINILKGTKEFLQKLVA